MGLKEFVKEGIQEVDEDSDPALARRRAEEFARQKAEVERREKAEAEKPADLPLPD